MIENRECPICNSPIMIEYIRPDFYFYIKDGKIVRDNNNDLWFGKDPYLRFCCSNDGEHDIERKTIVDNPDDISLFDWMRYVESKFFNEIFPEL